MAGVAVITVDAQARRECAERAWLSGVDDVESPHPRDDSVVNISNAGLAVAMKAAVRDSSRTVRSHCRDMHVAGSPRTNEKSSAGCREVVAGASAMGCILDPLVRGLHGPKLEGAEDAGTGAAAGGEDVADVCVGQRMAAREGHGASRCAHTHLQPSEHLLAGQDGHE
jgi:hypothetical protein